jgi:hypothetical protein
LENELKMIGENMKSLEVAEEKALTREEKYQVSERSSLIGRRKSHLASYWLFPERAWKWPTKKALTRKEKYQVSERFFLIDRQKVI